MTKLEAIRALLEENGVPYREDHHRPTRTAQEAADARGEPMQIGGKAIVAKVDKDFRVFVFSAAQLLSSRARSATTSGQNAFASPRPTS